MLHSHRRLKQLSASEPVHQWQTSDQCGEPTQERESERKSAWMHLHIFIEPYLQGESCGQRSAVHRALLTPRTPVILQKGEILQLCVCST